MTGQARRRPRRAVTLYERSEAGPDHILQILPQPPGGALRGVVVPPR